MIIWGGLIARKGDETTHPNGHPMVGAKATVIRLFPLKKIALIYRNSKLLILL